MTRRTRSRRVLGVLGAALHEPPGYPRAPTALLGWRVWVALGDHVGDDLRRPTLTWGEGCLWLGWLAAGAGVVVRVDRRDVCSVEWSPGAGTMWGSGVTRWAAPEEPPGVVLRGLRGFVGGLSAVACPGCHHPWGWHGAPGGCPGDPEVDPCGCTVSPPGE